VQAQPLSQLQAQGISRPDDDRKPFVVQGSLQRPELTRGEQQWTLDRNNELHGVAARSCASDAVHDVC
jgi:hypothetical protein